MFSFVIVDFKTGHPPLLVKHKNSKSRNGAFKKKNPPPFNSLFPKPGNPVISWQSEVRCTVDC